MRSPRRLRAGVYAAAVLLVVAMLPLVAPSAAVAATATIDRISGVDRYETAARVSAATFAAGTPLAYVASGVSFPDALTGAAAAGTQRAPVLLTGQAALPASTAGELKRLKPARVVVLGGEGAVSQAVLDQLVETTGAQVSRIEGADRFETSARLSAAVHPSGAGTVYLASGVTFPDALSAGSVAGAQNAPILLTYPSALPDVVLAELIRLRPTRVVVAGGWGAVSDEVVAQVRSRTGATVTRVSEADRYGTSAAISAMSFPSGAQTVYLASGTDFPDALAGAAAARGMPVLLVRQDTIPTATAAEIIRLRPTRIVLLGGAGAISETVRTRLSIVGTSLAQATAGRLTRDSEVRAGTCLHSPNSAYSLCVRADAGFGIFRGATALWTSRTPEASLRALRIGADGNAVLYSIDGRVVWQSSTAGTAATGLDVQNDGDLMLRTSAGAIVWSSMTSATAPQWRLPYAAGQGWAAGAPHANSGNTAGARGALDFGPVAGGDRRVLTIADGTVYRVQCGSGFYLGVNHANGWQSTYYHLVNYQEQLVGKFVPAGTYLGDVGRTVPCGGGATFDHVHLVIRRAGNPVSVEGVRFGGYTVASAGTDYWGFWTDGAGNRVVTARGGAACCLLAQ